MDNRSANKNGASNEGPRPVWLRQVCSRLLSDHAKAKQRGSSVLSADGVRHVRQLIRAASRPPARRPRKGPGSRPRRPRWDADLGELWLGTVVLHRFDKSAPAITPFLDAFEATGWTADSLPIPLRPELGETDADFRARVETTVKNLNRTVKNPDRKPRQPMLHFRLTRDRKGVRWELVPGKDRGPGRRR
jgi:hypothetical protein